MKLARSHAFFRRSTSIILAKKPPLERDWTAVRAPRLLDARRLPASASLPAVTEKAMISATAVVRTRRMGTLFFIGHVFLAGAEA